MIKIYFQMELRVVVIRVETVFMVVCRGLLVVAVNVVTWLLVCVVSGDGCYANIQNCLC